MVYLGCVKVWTALLLAGLVGWLGCGYHLVRHRDAPSQGQRVAIETLRNDSYEPGVEFMVTGALLREFLKRGALRVVDDPRAADLVVRGNVRPIRTEGRSFSSVVLALEYRITLDLDLTVTRRDGAQLPVPDQALRDSEFYLASADVEVTRKNRQEALRRLADVLAVRLHDSVAAGLLP